MSTMTTVRQWQDEFFTLVKRIEEPVVRFADERADAVARMVPERPTFMARMPKMTDLMESQLKFGKRMVDEQVRFAHEMMKAMGPVLAKLDAGSTPPAAPRSVKPVRTKKQAKRMTPALAHEPRRLTHHAS